MGENSYLELAGIWIPDVVVGRALGTFGTNLRGTRELGVRPKSEPPGRKELATIRCIGGDRYDRPPYSLSFTN